MIVVLPSILRKSSSIEGQLGLDLVAEKNRQGGDISKTPKVITIIPKIYKVK